MDYLRGNLQRVHVCLGDLRCPALHQDVLVNRSRLRADQLYKVQDDDLWFYTPDGVGGYWYDTWAEVVEQHGPLNYIVIESLTDW